MEKIALNLARDTISTSYEKEIEKAAKDAILDKNEQKKLSPWADQVVAKLRATTSGPLKTKDAVDAMDGKVRRALTAISKDHYNITKDEVKTLYVAELRAKVLDLFPPKQGGDTKDLAAAIAKTDIPEMNDYNKGFSLQSYGKGATLMEIAGDLVNEDLSDGDQGFMDFKKGKSGVQKFVDQIYDQAKEELESAEENDEAALGKKLKKMHEAVADEVEALFGDTSKFSEIHYHYNGIVEDGATEWAILIGKRNDGSWTAVTYNNFPF